MAQGVHRSPGSSGPNRGPWRTSIRQQQGEEHRGHGGMDGQKALGIELLSIQSMDAAVGRRWRPGEVGDETGR